MDIATPTTRRSLRDPISALALFAGGLAWIAAFWFPVFYTNQGPVEGYWVFATGWMGFAVFQFAWYANLLMLLGIIMMYSSPLWGSILAGFGVLVATQAFWFNSIPTGEVNMPILQLGQGFWYWYGSMVLLGVGVFLGSEQIEAEKNQTTTNQQFMLPEPKLKKIPPQESVVLAPTTVSLTSDQPSVDEVAFDAVNKPIDATHDLIAEQVAVPSAPIVLSLEQSAGDDVYEAVIKPEETVNSSSIEQRVDDLPATIPSVKIEPLPTPFAIVPEPELPNFAELAAVNEQEYLQLPNEVALKPVYTKHLAEDWPPQMSLVVGPDPFTTEPNLETNPLDGSESLEQEDLVKVEQKLNPASVGRPESAVGFFDPWKS